MTTYKLSIKGSGAINEDYIEMSVLNDSLVVAVSDGMGGMDCGDIAAKTVSESLVKYIIDNEHNSNDELLLHNALEYADNQLADEMFRHSLQMGAATLVAILSPHHLSFSWQGNVRLYLKHDNNIKLMTTDHQIETGYGEYRLTRCLKGQGLRIPLPFEECQISNGDTIYICTDGFYTESLPLLISDSTVEEMKTRISCPKDDATLIEIKL